MEYHITYPGIIEAIKGKAELHTFENNGEITVIFLCTDGRYIKKAYDVDKLRERNQSRWRNWRNKDIDTLVRVRAVRATYMLAIYDCILPKPFPEMIVSLTKP